MGKLVLIDGNSIANRAFYALPLLTNKKGIYTNAVFGFTQMLLKILADIKPEYILVAFDAGKITFRHSDYKEYKGKRQKTPSELSDQFPLIKDLLTSFKIKYQELEGYEADDIIGTIASEAEKKQIETIIYSGDKDLLQLSSDYITIYLARKGITEVDTYRPQEIMDKYQLTPEQIIDLKGLMGDASDNIPGVPGVGEKTALKLLHEYKSVENVLKHIEQISGNKLKENLSNNQEQALLSKRLATIFKEVPLELTVDDLHFQDYDKQQVYNTLHKLEFHSLIDRLGIEETNEVIENKGEELIIEHRQSSWNQKFINGDNLAIHLDYSPFDLNGHNILGIALSDGKEQIFLTLNQLHNWAEMLEWLKDENKSKWAYDSKGIEMALFWQGIQINGIKFDLMLGVYLLNPSDGTITLNQIAANYKYHGLISDESFYGKGAKWKVPEDEKLIEHIARKANAVFSIIPMAEKDLKDNNLFALLLDIELPLAKVLAKMEQTGVLIDTERLRKMGIELTEALSELTEKIYDIAGTEFNINSPKQMGEILFDKLELPVIKKTKTGYSTSADVLEKLEPHHQIIGHILHYRQLGKLYSTYIEGLLKVINPKTGKIHTSFNQAITATGRLSSTDPNLQNIPIRLEEGRKIRQVFIPSETDWLMLAADYSQIELRVLAHISEDKNLTQAFLDDMDIHTRTAMDIFDIEKDKVTSLMRRQAKAVNFGIVYGISDYGLSQNLNISRKEAGEFINKYFNIFFGVKKYMQEIVKKAKKDGFVTTLLNRRRYLPDINSRNFNIRGFAERTAMNTPIQGTAADIIKIAMVRISDILSERKLKSRLLLQVHDELIFEVHPREIVTMKEIVQDTMENAIELSVPLKVDMNVGKTWYESK